MADTFSSQVNAWTRKTKARTVAVFRDAAQTVVDEVRKTKADGGNMPVDTGNLRRSMRVSTSQLPDTSDKEFNEQTSIPLVIAKADIGDTVYMGFQASYAAAQEYGTSKTPANRFVGLTVQRWPEIVANSARNIEAKVKK